MQEIIFAIGHFTEAALSLLSAMGWLPSIIFTIVGFFGLFYWLMWQARYNRQARERNTLA